MKRRTAARRQRYAGPRKPRRPERDVLHAIARGHREAPEAIFRRSLELRGLKYTAERREILRTIMSAHAHFDADWLFLAMRKAGAKTSKATIYRSLALLCQVGILREAFHGLHGSTYEHVYGHEHHEHMICLKCGKVIEFMSRKLEKLQEDACRAMKFQPVQHHLQVFGYCRACE
ncbi:MAG: transcriptional repressor [Planctomycetota bacterium]|nr:transcriptional repressor [Planctomycetota bacterium]